MLQLLLCSVNDTGEKLLPVPLLLAINYCLCRCFQQSIITNVIVINDKLIIGVMKSIKIRDSRCQRHPQ
jgi:hypothetical protein